MKLLVTGGAGFIGSEFVRMAFRDRIRFERLTVIDALTYAGNLKNLLPVKEQKRFKFVHGDICDIKLVDDLVSDCDLVIHFAAESHVDRSITNPTNFIKTNVQGTNNLLASSLRSGVKKFIQISTDEVYGSIESGSWDENCPLIPNSPYSASKASADLVALSYFRTYGLDVLITRCSNNYGHYQNIEKAIPLFITNLVKNKKIPIYGSGENIRDWIHVSDHCEGIFKVIESGHPGEVYNFGGNSEITNISLARKILDIFSMPDSRIEHVVDRKGHDFRYSVDSSKAKKTLGWEPVIDFNAGLETTVDWYIKNQEWWN